MKVKEAKTKLCPYINSNCVCGDCKAWVYTKTKREMTIDLPIGQDRHSKNKMCISKTGKDALTHFKEIKTKGNYTLVKCQIETGRKHQIRVHLNHLHHPIIGDTLYGKTSSMIKRMALHAYCLEFIHPLTYQTIKIECLLPFDMEKIIR